MIVNFSVKNYKSIKDKIILSFEARKKEYLDKYYVVKPDGKTRLLKLAIIYGPNASGKTNILQALNSLKETIISPFEYKTLQFVYLEPFSFDDKTPEENTLFEIEFIKNRIKYLYSLEINKKSVVKEFLYYYNPKKALVFKRDTDYETQTTDIIFGSTIKITKDKKDALIANTLWNNTVLSGYLKTNIDQHELKEAVDWFKSDLFVMINPYSSIYKEIAKDIEENIIKKNVIIDILQKADLNISDIVVKRKDKGILSSLLNNVYVKNGVHDNQVTEIWFSHRISDKQYPLFFWSESAGTRRYFELAGLLSILLSENKIMPIDEIEASLHPELIKHFLLTFLVNSKQSQLILATHHRELLLDKDILRNDVIWFTEKKEDGSTDLFSLTDFDSKTIRNTSSIYKAYKTGKLGAIPNLSDYYIDSDYEKN